MLNEEIQRWKQRVEQISSSPRRAEPEECRKLTQEKQVLLQRLDVSSKDLTELR